MKLSIQLVPFLMYMIFKHPNLKYLSDNTACFKNIFPLSLPRTNTVCSKTLFIYEDDNMHILM